MNTEQALAFLLMHQPLPSTNKMSKELLSQFDQVRRHLIVNPDTRCLGPLLGALGEGDGHGVYQLVDQCLRAYEKATVVSALRSALESEVASVRMWAAELSAEYPDDALVSPLEQLARSGAEDARLSALIALNENSSSLAKRALADLASTDSVCAAEIAGLPGSGD